MRLSLDVQEETMSVFCQTFVQNAWRSDLCSNCFKSLEDHSESAGVRSDKMSTQRYVPQAPSLYQSRGISTSLKWRLSEPLYDRVAKRDFASQTPPKTQQIEKQKEKSEEKGILIKNSDRKLRSRTNVDFAPEEALVIGYGGNDYDSDLSPWEMGSDDGSIDFDQLDDNDEDRKITKLTKNNTEFNSSNQNLLKPDISEIHSKKEEEKRNNANNNINNKKTPTSTEKTVNITYNDIQAQKKQSQYYFPSPTDQLKSYLHKTSNSVETTSLKNNKEQSKLIDTNRVNNCNGEITKEDCKNLLNENFTPLNTRTYSFVSELSKHNVISEHSSDSDYSTCRLTAGDSTDSESFQDADESRIEPCPSFLHGNYPKGLSHSAIRELECDKKYDGGSSTSGDISNLSDDSDTLESSEITNYKLKSSRNMKASQEVENKKFSKEIVMVSSSEQMLPINQTINQNFELRSKGSNFESHQSTYGIPNNSIYAPKENMTPKRSAEDKKESPIGKESKGIKNSKDVVSIKVDSKNSSSVEKAVSKENRHMTVASNKEMDNASSTTSGECVTPKKRLTSNENKNVPNKTTPTAPSQINDDAEVTRKQSRRSPTSNQTITRQPQKIDNKSKEIDEQQKKSVTERDFIDSSDCEASPDTIAHRQSKLAALALELELARRDSARPNSINIPVMSQTTPPQLQRSSITPESEVTKPQNHIPISRQNSAPSSVTKLSQLPDILQETPTKSKKNRFSLKKLLKRNKDSSSLSITPTSKEMNPKAWKKQSFDRSRLSLEIVHPMDLTSDLATSGESTPTEESHYAISSHPGKGLFKSGYSRARSLSALPQVALESNERSNCSLIECRKVETLPSRKAGTVVERKKNRPTLVRTPSCSALPNRTQPTSETTDRSPPPKPPPPPKYKVMHPPPPPPPPHQLRCSKPATNSPARPPPPKILESRHMNRNRPDTRDQSHMDKEYANLGDIRSQLMPKKPERPSAVSVPRESETENKKDSEDLYETLQVAEEEEDHYTYLDDTEVKNSREISALNKETVSRFKTSKQQQPTCGRPWLDLQTSYSAIAATNYESLAEIITSSMNECPSYLKNDAKSLKLKDFVIDKEPSHVLLQNRLIYNVTYRKHEQEKVMLLIIPRKSGAPPSRNQTRYPVLASFNDYIPKQTGIASPNLEFASVYILPRSNISTLLQFTEITSREDSNQHIHLRNYCFILLQLIHTLKSLQAEGIEEVNFALEYLMLITTHEDKPPIFVLFPEDKIFLTMSDSVQCKRTLCQATLSTMFYFLNIKQIEELKTCLVNGELLVKPVADTFNAIAKVLLEEKASSLTQAKGFLEYMLWGPVDVKITDCPTEDDIEIILQRWLDLQRAQMVKSTITQLQLKVHSPTNLHVFEEYQLIYLLQASVKSLKSVISKL